jgi:glycerophosphoryl diester phosphodiesterase
MMRSPFIRAAGARPYVIGHRGALAHAPENTLASFRYGARLGVDAVELDVWRSADGVPVVMHDETLDRTTNGHGRVRETEWSEIRRLDAGSWSSPAYAGEPVPALDDVLRWARDDRVDVVVEIKQPIPASGRPPDSGLVASVIAAVRAHGMVDRTILISFHHPSIAEALALDPQVRTGLLTEGPELIDPLSAARAIPGVLGLHVRWPWVSERLCRAAHDAGMHVHAWGMAHPMREDAVRRMLEFGVDTLSADAPDELLGTLDRLGYGGATR